jgi:YcxB-like protein
MQIHCSLMEDDYQEFQRAYLEHFAGFWQRNLFKIFVPFGVIVIVAGLNWIFYLHRNTAYGVLCILCGLYLVWRAAWLRFWKWQRWFRKNAHLYANLQYEISEDDLLTRTATEETKAQWGNYPKYTESKNLILLMDGRGSYLVFPKRAFNPTDLNSFLELLKRKVKASG